jgi:hypothetical protein
LSRQGSNTMRQSQCSAQLDAPAVPSKRAGLCMLCRRG